MQKILAGHKLRRLRQSIDLSQRSMAEILGISSSYLNLLEHNQRPLTAALLLRIGNNFDINLLEFAEDDNASLAVSATEVFSDPILADEPISRREIQDMVSAAPTAARGIIKLFQAYRSVRDELEATVGNSRDVKVIGNPVEQVRDILQKAHNYFPTLEEKAEELRLSLMADSGLLQGVGGAQEVDLGATIRHIKKAHNVTTRIMPVQVMQNQLRRYDMHRSEILISEILLRPQRVFHLLVQLAMIENEEIIEAVIKEYRQHDQQTLSLLKVTLAAWFAGAVMMPYQHFLESAKALRYDIDLLCRRFGTTFEQTCHRLTTLHAPNARGIPFAFIRTDDAGNISKRISAAGINFASHGGGCPKWAMHRAFRTPDKILVQAAELPNGQQILSMARSVSSQLSPAGKDAPEFTVALCCELHHAPEIIYADRLDLGKNKVLDPVGINCSVCERMDCTQRSHPPIGHELRFDGPMRRVGFYDLG